ncbi:MAG: hypothetical protein Phyf2KO_04390 [Phycisphaerales bacterium]
MTANQADTLAPLSRDLDRYSSTHYDVIVVGGGIQGACLLYEAAKRGLKGLLVERDDFGGATSWNSMRVLHGGFRYLQSLDIPRLVDSVRERRWFMRMFPGLTEPLSCMMPLYGHGLKRPGAFKAALRINRQLTRLEGRLPNEQMLPSGHVITPSDVAQDWPQVPTVGLQGGGVWYDAKMLSPERIVVHLLRVSQSFGCGSLNYCAADSIETVEGTVAGVRCTDSTDGREYVFHAPIVLNAAGPWCREVSSTVAVDRPELFTPMRAFNLVLDRSPMSESAIAVRSASADSQMFFLLPHGDKTIAGTAQVPCDAGDHSTIPSKSEVESFIYQINEAAPGLDVSLADVTCVWHGQVSASFAGSSVASDKPVVIDHTEYGGPTGLISVSGVKYTTARRLAKRVVGLLPGPPVAPLDDVVSDEVISSIPGYGGDGLEAASSGLLRSIVENEGVVNADDLIIRRTGLWQDPDSVLMDWDVISGALGFAAHDSTRQKERVTEQLRLLREPWSIRGACN